VVVQFEFCFLYKTQSYIMSYLQWLSKDTLTCVVLYLGSRDRIALFAAVNIAGNVDWVRLHGTPKITDRIRDIHDSIFKITRRHRLAQMRYYANMKIECIHDSQAEVDITESNTNYKLEDYEISLIEQVDRGLANIKIANGTVACHECNCGIDH
jgi:hypothetical protein